MGNQNIKYKDVPLIKEIEKCNDNILYYGEGGIGKTTQMQLAFNYFSSKCTNTVPVFLDADKEIDFRKADPLMSAIAGKYLDSDIETDDIWKLFTNNSPSSAKNYTYIIFVDGINELTQNNKGYLIEKITHIINESKNTRFIISSRIKENLGLRFKNIAIKPLEKKNILKYLGENYGVNDNSKNINDSLVEILQIPLYLSVFKNTYNGSDYKPNIYDESTVRKADILDSYIQKILHEKRKTNAADTALFEFIVKYFLPALAFEMVKENVHVISIMDFRKLRDNTEYFETFCYDENALDIFEQNSRKAHNYIVENFALLESHKDVYTFTHQIWRDYFCAKHIINCLNVTYSEQIKNDLEIPVDNEIRGFVGQLIYTYDEKFHYSKDEHFPSKKSDRMCECDFEAKDNLEDWYESPIEHYMQQHNLEQEGQNQISPLVTCNLIEIMKASRNNHITSNFNSLQLKQIDFTNSNIANSSFNNSSLSSESFLIDGHTGYVYDVICYDNFVISTGLDRTIRKWSLQTFKQIDKITNAHKECITSLSKLGNNYFVSGGFDNTIKIWNANDFTYICEAKIDHQGIINNIITLGNYIYICGKGIYLSKWLFDNKRCTLVNNIESNSTKAITTYNRKIIYVKSDKEIMLYDEAQSDYQSILTSQIQISSLCCDEEKNRLFIGFFDGSMQIIDLNDKNTIRITYDQKKSIESIVIDYVNNLVLCGGYEGILQIYDRHSLRNIVTTQLHNDWINSISVSNGKHCVIASGDQSLSVYNLSNFTKVGVLIGNQCWINTISKIPCNNILISGSDDKTIRLWDCTNKRQIYVPFQVHNARVNSVIAINNNEFVSGGDDNNLYLWKINKKECICINHFNDWVRSINITKDNKTLLVGCWDGSITLFDIDKEYKKIISDKKHNQSVERICSTSNSKYIISASDGGEIIIWQKSGNTFKFIKKINISNHSVRALDISDDDKYIVCADSTGNVVYLVCDWESATYKQINYYNMKCKINDLKIINKKVLLAADNGKIYKQELLGQIQSMLISNVPLSSVVSLQKDEIVATSGMSGTVSICDSCKSQKLYTLNPIQTIVFGCDFSQSTFTNDLNEDSNKIVRILYQNGAKVSKFNNV